MEGPYTEGETIFFILILGVVLFGLFVYLYLRSRTEKARVQSWPLFVTRYRPPRAAVYARRACRDFRRLGPWLLVPLGLGCFRIIPPLHSALQRAKDHGWGSRVKQHLLRVHFANHDDTPGTWMLAAVFRAGERILGGFASSFRSVPGAVFLLLFSFMVLVYFSRRRHRSSPKWALHGSIILVLLCSYLLASETIQSFAYLADFSTMTPANMVFLSQMTSLSFLAYPLAVSVFLAAWIALTHFVLLRRLCGTKPKPALLLKSLRRSLPLQLTVYLIAGLPIIFRMALYHGLIPALDDRISALIKQLHAVEFTENLLWIVALPIGITASFQGWGFHDLARRGPAFARRYWRPLLVTFLLSWALFLLADFVHWFASRSFEFRDMTGVWPGIITGMTIFVIAPVLSVIPLCVLFRLLRSERRRIGKPYRESGCEVANGIDSSPRGESETRS